MDDDILRDANNNTASIKYFGSREAAQWALDSLKDCSYCSDCSDCSRCSYCSYCSYCSGCSYCSDCSDCSDCSYCSYCSYCSGCSGCSYCSDCSDCSDCSYCSGKKEKKKNVPLAIPKIDGIHQKIFDAASRPQALDMANFHACEKTHCRAGWTVTLAGEQGQKLESFFNTELAAMLIYRESGYKINPARFYDDNKAALADMKRLAESEQPTA